MKSFSRTPAPVYYNSGDGRLRIELLGAAYTTWRDPYHAVLTIPWATFLLLIALAFLGFNAIFGLLYLIGEDNINNAAPGSFLDAFFFSVQTMATIGYGGMTPNTVYADVLVTLESLTGLLGLSMATSVMFARFTRPTAKVLFSRVAVVAPHEGQPTLAFRVANQRRNFILEAQIRVHLLLDETTAEGQFIRRIYDLPLVRNRTPAFTLSWLVLHPLDAHSPLCGLTTELLEQKRASLLVTLTGVDTTLSQAIYARYSYGDRDILWNMQLVDIFTVTPDGRRVMDYGRFHDVEPLLSPAQTAE